MKNFILTIEYDGTGYHGWQRQKSDRTIQETIEKAIETMTRQKIVLSGSGRTDACVHALGQTASFRCDTRLTAEILKKGLNSLLPDDIVIRDCRIMHNDFHARYDVKSKMYRYQIINAELPPAIGRQYIWHIKRPLDIAAMETAAGLIVGKHDFKAFEGAGSPRAHTIRQVFRAQFIHKADNLIHFEIEADGFLRFMVRNIVGTLVEVGLGKSTPDDFGAILDSKNRARAGATAPAQGLFLIRVSY